MVTTVPVGTKIVERVAATNGVEPADLDVRLFDAIDAEALQTFIESLDQHQQPDEASVRFSYHGHSVAVDGDGGVSVDAE